jgi:hypothetical protein
VAERRGLVIGARIASGTVAAGVAAVVIAAVAFLPLPTSSLEPRTVGVDPAPADQVRVCPGSALRLGDAAGGNADTTFAIGTPTIAGAVSDGDLERSRLLSADESASSASAPELLRVPPSDGALLAGAQVQSVGVDGFRGLSAASCAEPTGSAWLVGGATTVGRTTLLVLANPTEVPSRVSLEIFGEDGLVSAPGMSGIDVPAGAQRVLSLAGFAPGLESPVVHVSARGGRIVASLQQSIVRGLDSTGLELIGAGADPAVSLVVPGVRILDAVGTGRASGLADWQDVVPVVRIGMPGGDGGQVEVRVVPEGGGIGTSFVVELEGGEVADIPLDAGGEEGDGSEPAPDDPDHAHGLQDGMYTVFVDAEVPVVAAVRVSTAVDAGDTEEPASVLSGPPSDVAWFAAAPPLDGGSLVVVPDGPSPRISIVNPTADGIETELTPAGGGDPIPVVIPAGSSATFALEPGAYLLAGSESLSVTVSFAAAAALASFVVSPARPVAGLVVVHPD